MTLSEPGEGSHMQVVVPFCQRILRKAEESELQKGQTEVTQVLVY